MKCGYFWYQKVIAKLLFELEYYSDTLATSINVVPYTMVLRWVI